MSQSSYPGMLLLCHLQCATSYHLLCRIPPTMHRLGARLELMVVHGGEKESSVPELCSLETVCGQACIYRHILPGASLPPYYNHPLSYCTLQRSTRTRRSVRTALQSIQIPGWSPCTCHGYGCSQEHYASSPCNMLSKSKNRS